MRFFASTGPVVACLSLVGTLAVAGITPTHGTEQSASIASHDRAARSASTNDPDAMAAAGPWVWIANRNGNSITQVSRATGRVRRTIGRANPMFAHPVALSYSDGYLWVANDENSSVDQLNPNTGREIRSWSGAKYGLAGVSALVSTPGYLWVANTSENSVSVISLRGGSVRILMGASYGLDEPTSIISVGDQVWIGSANSQISIVDATDLHLAKHVLDTAASRSGYAGASSLAMSHGVVWYSNRGDDVVLELSARSGRILREFSSATYQLAGPWDVSSGGGSAWVVDGRDELTVIGRDGVLHALLKSPPYPFSGPDADCVAGSEVFVANAINGSVTVMSRQTMRLQRVIHE